MYEAAGKGRGLPRTGTGQNKLNASGSGSGPLLQRIEGIRCHGRLRFHQLERGEFELTGSVLIVGCTHNYRKLGSLVGSWGICA